jgi:hypothetical protein
MAAGDYTLSQTSSSQLVFDGWTCYKANVLSGKSNCLLCTS